MASPYLTAHERAAALAHERAEEARAEIARMPAWRRSLLRVRVPSRLVLALCAFFALKLVAVLTLGPSVWSGAKCTRHTRPLWNTSFVDWHEAVLFDDTPALEAFVATANDTTTTLLLGHATRDAVELVHAWACSARRVGLEPRVVSLDGDATCRALAPRVPCLFLKTHAGSLSPTSAYAHEHATQHRLTQRARLAWRVLALGHDVVLSDADVVFAPAFTQHWRTGQWPENADLVVLAERGAVQRWRHPNFGFVAARASPRTVAFFQMLHHAQSAHRLVAERAYAACSLWSSLRLAYFDENAFVVGSARYTGLGVGLEASAAALMHVSSIGTRTNRTHAEQKAALLRSLGLWCVD